MLRSSFLVGGRACFHWLIDWSVGVTGWSVRIIGWSVGVAGWGVGGTGRSIGATGWLVRLIWLQASGQ